MKAFFKTLFMIAVLILAVIISLTIYGIIGYLFGSIGCIMLTSLSFIALFVFYYIEEKRDGKDNN